MPQAGVPESFKVLVKELQSLGLDVKVLDANNEEIDLKQNIDGDEGVSLHRYHHSDSELHTHDAEEEEHDEESSDDDLDLDDLDLGFDFDDDVDFESAEEEEAFDVNAFFNEINPTINDAGFSQGFVPDDENM